MAVAPPNNTPVLNDRSPSVPENRRSSEIPSHTVVTSTPPIAAIASPVVRIARRSVTATDCKRASSRVSTPSSPNSDRRVIAATSAAPSPSCSGVKVRAASIQKTRPSKAPPTCEPTCEAKTFNSRFCWSSRLANTNDLRLGRRDSAGIHALDSFDNGADGEFAGAVASRDTERPGGPRIAQYRSYGLCQRRGITRPDQESGGPVDDHVEDPSRGRSDDWPTRGHRLEHDGRTRIRPHGWDDHGARRPEQPKYVFMR